MTRDLKRKLAANILASVVVPVTQVAVNHHFDKQIMEKRQEHEIRKVERRAEALGAVTGEPVRNTSPGIDSRPRSPQVYEGLEHIQRTTDCGFCYSAAESLMRKDRETAAEGLSELQEYHDYLDQIDDVPPEQMEADIESIVQGWEVVPRVIGGT